MPVVNTLQDKRWDPPLFSSQSRALFHAWELTRDVGMAGRLDPHQTGHPFQRTSTQCFASASSDLLDFRYITVSTASLSVRFASCDSIGRA